MKSNELDLVISVDQRETRIALLEGGSLIDYQIEDNSLEFAVGDIYLGEIKKKSTSLNSF